MSGKNILLLTNKIQCQRGQLHVYLHYHGTSSGHPVLNRHLSIPLGCLLDTGLTVWGALHVCFQMIYRPKNEAYLNNTRQAT